MVTLLGGLVGGLVATIVMTAAMMTLGDGSPPPTAAFWATYVGGGSPDEYLMQGMVLHLGYGTGAGIAFAWLGVAGLIAYGSIDTLAGGLVNGIAYGIVLFVVAAVVWMRIVLRMDAEPRQVGMFLLFHLVYGVVLGAVLSILPF